MHYQESNKFPMRAIVIFVLLTSSMVIWAQNFSSSSIQFKKEWLCDKENVSICLSEINEFDLSEVWLTKQSSVLGFIGENYQRFYIRFISITKDPTNSNTYLVYGKTRVKQNICDFNGKIEIIDAKTYNQTYRKKLLKAALDMGDEEAANRHSKLTGFVIAEYSFFENPRQSGSGFLTGVIKSDLYFLNKDIFFNDLELSISDNYRNNLHVGSWESYKSNTIKNCNWGCFRIPGSGDLDVGTGLFSPNMKYLENGWKTYYDANVYQDKEAIQEEINTWWIY